MKWTKRARIELHRLLIPLGIDSRRLRNDRKLLEKTIFPYLLKEPRFQRILFVGTAWYNLHYPTLFRNKEFYTLEIDPQQATYGSNRHIIDSCVHLNKHFAPDFLDCVIFNGVFGFGLNDPSDIEATFEGIYQTLRNRGLFIFGHNTLPETSPCPIDSIEHLKRFRSVDFEPLGTSVLASDPVNQHWFRFYEK